MPNDTEETGVLDHIWRLSSAEDIFIYLLLPYDQAVMNVSRLHVMKRFGSYLRDADLEGESDAAVFLACREFLKQAYLDFIDSTPLKEKVFKVFRDEEAKLKARFVGIETLKVAGE
jgi:nitrogenase-stabilizing/protective protein